MSATPSSEIRIASAADAGAVAQLLHDFNSEYEDFTPGVPALTERVGELLGEVAVTVFLAGDPPLGLALIRLRPSLWSRAGDAYLEELYVVPAHRGEGIGGALLDTAIEQARQMGANHFELTTGETDTAARALYESRSFTNKEGGPDGPQPLKAHSLRNPGTSMSSSLTRNFRISVSSADTRGLLS